MNRSAQAIIISGVCVIAFRKEQRNQIMNEHELAFCKFERKERPYAASVEIHVRASLFAEIWKIEVQPQRNEYDISGNKTRQNILIQNLDIRVGRQPVKINPGQWRRTED